jgi:hypothetical protein
MAIEQLLTKEIIVPLAFFGMPVAMLWIKKHYAALEKGHVKGTPAIEESRVQQLEQQNRELLARVQNLESIVCALDEAPRPKALPATQKMIAD